LLPASPIHAGKAELARIRRQRAGALKSPPLRLRAFQISKRGRIAANFHFGRAVHYNLNRAFAMVWPTAAHYRHPARLGLSV
jgi:hypothetical protein